MAPITSRDELEKLNINFNYSMINAKKLFGALYTKKDRDLVRQWISKLKNCISSVDEMKLRNDFMFYLIVNMQAGALRHPFDKPPKSGPLSMQAYDGGVATDKGKGSVSSSSSKHSWKTTRQLQQPPPAARFLVPTPMPKVGAIFYMALKCKGDNVSA